MTKKRVLRNVEAVAQMKAGEHKSQTKTVMGFSDAKSQGQKQQRREFGEIWEEKDSTGKHVCWWEITEHGTKIKHVVHPDIAKALREARDYIKRFPNCPKDNCTCTVRKAIDEKFRRLTGMCEDCTISYETSLKIRGEFNEYALTKMRHNAEAYFNDADKEIEKIKIAMRNTELLSSENGDVEKWTHEGLDAYLQQIDQYYQQVKETVFGNLNGRN